MQAKTFNIHKVAIAAHIHYPELWPEIAGYLQALDYPYDLFITTPEAQGGNVTALVKEGFPQAAVHTFPDEGADILPFLKLIPELVAAGYVAVCKLHTKQGHDELASSWRKLMLDTLVGNTDTITAVTQAFADDEQLAMLGPGALYLSVQKSMYAQNQDNIEILAQAVGISSLPQDWGFFAGTMFWVRSALLRTLAEQIRHFFEGEAAQKQADGRLEHALERLLGLLPVSSQQKLALLLPCTGSHKRVVLQKKVSPQTISQAYTQEILQQYQRLTTDRARLIQSGLFDNAAYIQQCPELLGCAADLPSHYLLVGRFQQATPHPDFDPRFYTQQYGAHFVAGESPFLHYLREGAKARYLLRPTKQQKMEKIPNGLIIENWHSDGQDKSLSIQTFEPHLKYKPTLQHASQTGLDDEHRIIPTNKLLCDFFKKMDKQAFINSNPNLKDRFFKEKLEDIENYFINFGYLEMAEGIIKFHEKFEAFHEKEYTDKHEDVRKAIKNKSCASGFEHFLKNGYDQIISGKRKYGNHSICKHKIKKDLESDIQAGKLKFHPIFPEYNEHAYLIKNPRIKKLVALKVFSSGFDHFLKFGYAEILSGKRSHCYD